MSECDGHNTLLVNIEGPANSINGNDVLRVVHFALLFYLGYEANMDSDNDIHKKTVRGMHPKSPFKPIPLGEHILTTANMKGQNQKEYPMLPLVMGAQAE